MASQAARKLSVVNDPPERPERPAGDPTLTLEALSEWSAGQRRCRARKRHNWGPHVVYERRTTLEVVERCSHCGNRRSADFVRTEWGLRKATKWAPDYRGNYLLPKGAAPIDEELHDGLVAADILSRKTIEVPEDEEA